MKNLDDICKHADMVIVARGDLSIECGLFNIIENQKKILKTAKKFNKISSVGTGFLTLYPPQQSTIADIYNAVLDGADSLIVSGDLPEGEKAVEAITLLDKMLKSFNL